MSVEAPALDSFDRIAGRIRGTGPDCGRRTGDETRNRPGVVAGEYGE